MKLVDILKAGEGKIEEALIPQKVEQAKKQVELELANTDVQIAQLALNLERAKSKYPINLAAIVEATNALEQGKKNRETVKTVAAELF